MNLLEQARVEIDRIDNEMARLFEQRMKAAELVAEHKKIHCLPIEDKARENAMIKRNAEGVEFAYRPYYEQFLTSLITESKKYQKCLLEGMTIAYSGVEGAFAHLAARRIFKAGTTVACQNFEEAYRAVEQGRCDCAVLPIENSYAGDVDTVMDLAYRGTLSISGIYDMPLSQSLLGKPGVAISEIKEVCSHPQALSQCMPYLQSHGWQLTQAVNTAMAAQAVAQGERRDIAVVAAREAAEIYGLEVLEGDINENKNNTTRFAVFTRTPCEVAPADKHFVLMFTIKNEPGSLGRAIAAISEGGFNLKCLKSHPTGNENWSYYFYSEGEGNLGSPEGKAMLADLGHVCEQVKLLGSFASERVLECSGKIGKGANK
ncbi:MAG: chorismate mutase [Clostridia bacterium]|nr:chorismate mutase [Clostridia bacterium]